MINLRKIYSLRSKDITFEREGMGPVTLRQGSNLILLGKDSLEALNKFIEESNEAEKTNRP